MNLKRLFQIQEELDNAIVEKKGLQGRNLLSERILALQVELGECANEWRGFKFWKQNPLPQTKKEIECTTCNGTGDENYEANFESLMEEKGSVPHKECTSCNGSGIAGYKNPLLEEYVDCLHFFLSIGISIGHTDFEAWEYSYTKDETKQFLAVFGQIDNIRIIFEDKDNIEPDDCVVYETAFAHFLALGKMLGFTWGEIEQAYLQKNEINHKRQETGY
ncbi:dUTP diphosphatase [Shouchella clausii]|uniref:dUTP diphosphatase n=1 Tax=Shouchella clausii TaxID=79880 RepID=UPI0028A1566B|nr:dUTP diphosphatase [Shouchella clausii]